MKEPKRIHWTQKEFDLFFTHARSFGPPQWGDSAEVYAKTMALMPVNRRRSEVNPHLMARMNEARRALAQPIPVVAETSDPPKVEVQPKVEEPELTPPGETPEVSGEISGAQFMADLLSDVVLRVFTNPEVHKALRELVRVPTLSNERLEPEQAIIFREPSSPRERKPRIVVAGGHPSSVREQLLNLSVADVRYWKIEESIHRLTSMAKQADLTVVVTNRMSHKAEMALRGVNAKMVRHPHSAGLRDLIIERATALSTSKGE
jgi:hypothetical protein